MKDIGFCFHNDPVLNPIAWYNSYLRITVRHFYPNLWTDWVDFQDFMVVKTKINVAVAQMGVSALTEGRGLLTPSHCMSPD